MLSSSDRRVVQITITEKCNLNCIYCYEHAKDLNSLSIDFIKRIIEREFNNPQYNRLEFDFHGGEPALAFDVLKPICEWLWSRKWDKPYMCFATTNGTLIHGEIKEWFRNNYERFCLSLSLDGTRMMHNLNRSNSYDDIDLDFFKKMWPEQTVKMTISPATLPYVSDGIKHIHSLGYKLTANLAHGMKWTQDLLPIYRDQLLDISNFYIENPLYCPCRIVNFDLKRIGMEALFPKLKCKRKKWCGAGDPMVCYGVNGKSYPCQLFAPSSGSLSSDSIFDKWNFSEFKNFVDPVCAKCDLDGACPTCYGMNYVETGTLHTRPKDMCDFLKCEAVATSYLYGKMFVGKKQYPILKKMSESERLAVLKGIQIVQNGIANEVMKF
jgi:sulfatase maturation enzyme AslB (radical SAM superfamily)